MNKGILIALVVALAVGLLALNRVGVKDADVSQVTTVSPALQKEAAFQESQATSADTSTAAIEADLNSTVILEEDFSDLENV